MQFTTTPSGWLAFELSILHRLNFSSVAIPLTGDPAIGNYLKRRNVRVAANDVLQSDWQRSLAVIANTTKGRGVSFMQDVAKWHHGVPSDSEYAAAIRELDEMLAMAEAAS